MWINIAWKSNPMFWTTQELQGNTQMEDTGNYKGEKEGLLLRKQKKSVKEKYVKSIIQIDNFWVFWDSWFEFHQHICYKWQQVWYQE